MGAGSRLRRRHKQQFFGRQRSALPRSLPTTRVTLQVKCKANKHIELNLMLASRELPFWIGYSAAGSKNEGLHKQNQM